MMMSSVAETDDFVEMDDIPAGKHGICRLDHTGDSKFIWDPAAPDEVEGARMQFDKLKAKGYLAYTVKEGGDKGEVMGAFDPKAGKIIMARALTGG